MTDYKTRTEELGTVTFTAPAAAPGYAGYVWIDGPAFSDRRQICYGGGFTGPAVTATPDDVKTQAQRWIRDRARTARKA